jgi:hypothetical protein
MTTLADLTDDQRAQLAAAEALVRFAHRDGFRDAVAHLLDRGLDLTVVIRMLTGVVPVPAAKVKTVCTFHRLPRNDPTTATLPPRPRKAPLSGSR